MGCFSTFVSTLVGCNYVGKQPTADVGNLEQNVNIAVSKVAQLRSAKLFLVAWQA